MRPAWGGKENKGRVLGEKRLRLHRWLGGLRAEAGARRGRAQQTVPRNAQVEVCALRPGKAGGQLKGSVASG